MRTKFVCFLTIRSGASMSDKIAVQLGDVQKTLFLPLWGRAVESKKKDPLLRDARALDVMNKIEFDFSPLTNNVKSLTQLGWIQRSLLMDQTIRGFMERYPSATIVNIGCGLDTTFERVDNGLIRWFDLDLPDVIALRKTLIPESDRSRMIASSFLEEGWWGALIKSEHVLFVAAGVFYYHEESEIRGFFRRLLHQFPGSEMVFDICSPFGMRVANKIVISASGLGEKSFLKWGLKDAREIERWDRGIRILREQYYFRKVKKGFTFRDRVQGLISDALKTQWLIHLRFSTQAEMMD